MKRLLAHLDLSKSKKHRASGTDNSSGRTPEPICAYRFRCALQRAKVDLQAYGHASRGWGSRSSLHELLTTMQGERKSGSSILLILIWRTTWALTSSSRTRQGHRMDANKTARFPVGSIPVVRHHFCLGGLWPDETQRIHRRFALGFYR
jgi:hypothetical protein